MSALGEPSAAQSVANNWYLHPGGVNEGRSWREERDFRREQDVEQRIRDVRRNQAIFR